MVVARNSSAVLVDEICALEHLVLDIGVIHRQTQGMVDRLQMDIIELDIGARMQGRAIQRGGNVVSRGTVDVGPGDILDLHLGGVAVLIASGGVDALGDLDGKSDVNHLDVFEGDVLDQAAAAAAGVAVSARRLGHTLPGLDICAVLAVQAFDVLEGYVLHVVRRQGVLAQRSDGHAPGPVAGDILDEQVGGVSFDGDAVIAVVDDCVLDEEGVAVPRVVAICIDCAPLIVAGGVNVQVRDGDVLAVRDKGCPELRLDNGQVIGKQVGGVGEGNADRSTGLVAVVAVLGIPGLALAIIPAALASEGDVRASKKPGGGLVLENDTVRMGEPVRNVGGPAQLAAQQDITVQQVGGVEDRVDVESVVAEDDTPVLSAFVKCLVD